MQHPERKQARGIDTPGRSRRFTDAVYSGAGDAKALYAELQAAQHAFDPPPPEYKLFIGEMHGHTSLSDGDPDIDRYFTHLRDELKLDFGAVSDHDHGGVGKPELWVGNPSKWNVIQEKVKEYYRPGTFTTLLAYERDAYPYYNNMVIYYRGHEGKMFRGVHDGEITAAELRSLLADKNILVIPHDTYYLSAGADFNAIPTELIPPLIEIYSRGDATEYMGNPANDLDALIEGGWWQDALRKGAHMGCIAGSDDHFCKNGVILKDVLYPHNFPGLTGVWTTENTAEGIFDALRARRCYGFMGGNVRIDFRINGHWMGEAFACPARQERTVWYNITADADVRRVTVVKNCRDQCIFGQPSMLYFDYRQEREEDCYYLRIELADGRFAWTSPIWIRTASEPQQ